MSGSVTHLIRVGRMSASSRSRERRELDGGRLLDRLSDRPLEQHIGRGDADRAAVAAVAGVGEPPVGDPALDADPVAAERVDVLEGGIGLLQARPGSADA